jgi:hypothetical protein
MWLYTINVHSQDYFEDANGNGIPIISGDFGNLLSTRANISDNSIKINLFTNFVISNHSSKKVTNISIKKTYFGAGLFAKGKAENGISNLFKSGDLQEGFNLGGYLSLEKFSTKNKGNSARTKYIRIIFTGLYTSSNLKLYSAENIYSKQLYDTNFTGYSFSLSGYFIPPLKRGSLILGLSLSNVKTNNYSGLDKYEIKEIRKTIDSTGTITREIVEEKDNYLYGVGKYEEFNKYKIRLSCAYIPGFFDNKISFILYPSSEYRKHKNPIYNIGISINFLKNGIPVLSDAGLNVEFNDVSNVANSTKKFIDRSMKIGLNAAINIFGDKVSK